MLKESDNLGVIPPPTEVEPVDLPAHTSKRVLDLSLGAVALAVSAPVLISVAIISRAAGERGPFFHRSARVGRDGHLFTLWKIRTMTVGTDGLAVTSSGDERVTRVGRVLRRYKIDELPQLWNVVRGEMSLVGPRPEDQRFVDWEDPLHRKVFTAKPGITGLAQLEFSAEEALLVDGDPERVYREEILPTKLLLDSYYLDNQTTRLDLQILGRTLAAVLHPRRP